MAKEHSLAAFGKAQGNVEYGYDNANRKTSMEDATGTTAYVYDDANRLTSLTNPHSQATTWTYDNANRVTRQDTANGTYVLYDYDVRDRVTEIDHQKSTNVRIVRERLTYDDAGNIVESIVASVTTTYSYDDINQLLTETYNGTTTSYTYDANGNRATKTAGGVTETYVYDDADKLDEIMVGGTPIKEYGYDAAGRTTSVVTSAGTTTLSYDYESRITGITYPNTSTNSFTYNGLDTRVSKTDSGGTKTFRRDGAYVTDPVLTDGTTTFTPGISNRTGTTSKWEHPDHLGSNIRQTAAAETVTSTLRFDAFGNLVAATGTHSGPFGFAGGHGYQADNDSGLMLLGNRYYDSSTGRFLTRDPIKDGRNWYVYCDSNPVTSTDGSGLLKRGRGAVDSVSATANQNPRLVVELVHEGVLPMEVALDMLGVMLFWKLWNEISPNEKPIGYSDPGTPLNDGFDGAPRTTTLVSGTRLERRGHPFSTYVAARARSGDIIIASPPHRERSGSLRSG